MGGHHYALDVTYNGTYSSATPFCIGVEPKCVNLNRATITALEKQRAAACALSQTLTSNNSAVLSGTFDDVLMGVNGSTGHDTNYPQTYPTSDRGGLYSSLSTTQQALVKPFIELRPVDRASSSCNKSSRCWS